MQANTGRIVDITIPLTPDYKMHTPAGVTDVQIAIDVLKDYDAPGGAGQLVRGLRARLHHGTHVDAPEHFVRGGEQLADLPLEIFVGPAVVADVRRSGVNQAIDVADLSAALPETYRPGDRLLIRTDWNTNYGKPGYREGSPFLTVAATQWCAQMRFPLVGLDFAHTKDAPDAPGQYYITRHFCESRVVTMGYVTNLEAISSPRVTLIALPLALHGAEASPVRAVVLDADPGADPLDWVDTGSHTTADGRLQSAIPDGVVG